MVTTRRHRDRSGREVRYLLIMTMLVVFVFATGCAPVEEPKNDAATNETPAPSDAPTGVPEGWGVEGPVDNPEIPREDSRGRVPEQLVMEAYRATSERDWARAYALHTTPPVTLTQATEDWVAADTVYESFEVHETRVQTEELAFVRVTQESTFNIAQGQRTTVKVEEPGQWWAIEKVAGEWRIRWMPVQ